MVSSADMVVVVVEGGGWEGLIVGRGGGCGGGCACVYVCVSKRRTGGLGGSLMVISGFGVGAEASAIWDSVLPARLDVRWRGGAARG